MTKKFVYVKLDAKLPGKGKVASVSDAGFRAWVLSICYCGDYLTDGVLPAAVVGDSARYTAARAELLKTGLWETLPGGDLYVHDYLDWNDSRAATEDRIRRGKEFAARRYQDTQQDTHKDTHQSSHTTPTPALTPTPKQDQKPALASRERDLVFEAVCAAYGIDWHNLTGRSRAVLNAAVADLKLAPDATPEEICRRAAFHRESDLGTPTPSALVKHWPQLAGGPVKRFQGGTEAPADRLRRQAQEMRGDR